MSSSVKAKSPLRLGIIGIGNMGGYHARMVAKKMIPHCKLAAVCDIAPEKLAAAEQKFPNIPQFTNSDDLIKSGLVDAVLIATPHYSHTPIGIRALTAGLHVLMEKPVAVHKADCQKLIAAHKNKRQIFACVFNQRTDPRYRKIRELIISGKLGALQRIQWTITNWYRSDAYYASSNWRATWSGEGGGLLLNQCVHNIDLYQWIFGQPNEVRAFCKLGRHHDIEVEDEVTAVLEHANGATGLLVTSTGESPGINRLEIVGDLGRLSLENDQLIFLQNKVPTSLHSRQTKEAYQGPACKKLVISVPNHGTQHLGIIKNFVNAIRNGEELIAPAQEGIRSVELINAMLLSSLKNKTVKLPISAGEYQTLLNRLTAKSKKKKQVIPYRGKQGNYLTKI